MFNKLNKVLKRYHEINELLGEGSIYNDKALYTEITKEFASIKDLSETYMKYQKVNEEMKENKILLDDDDDDIREMAKEEMKELEEQKYSLEEELKILLIPKDPNDEKNVLLEIRAGTGGDESAIFAGELFKMYSYFAERHNWKIDIISSSDSDMGGYKEIIANIKGDKVYSYLKYEAGVHRVQRVPETESQGRVHTSACTVAIMPEAEDVDIVLEDKDLRIDVYRSSGPGGQSVNTTDSAIRVTYLPTNTVVICQDEKSQLKNKQKALKVLKTRLYQMKLDEQNAEIAANRKSQVGTGDRSERIRTYNFPQGRFTDHRIGLTLYKLDYIMNGDLEDIIVALRTHYQTLAMSSTEK
jgi:peptide chain release factor 1